MKHRFVIEKQNSYLKNLLVSLSVFAAIFLIFWLGVSSVSSKAHEEELHTLQTAVTRGITHCYAIEGVYPKSLTYLKENYGLTYDEDKYFIDYQPQGSNLMPDVTIITKADGKPVRL